MSSATSTSSLPSGLAVLTTFPDVLFIPELVSATFSSREGRSCSWGTQHAGCCRCPRDGSYQKTHGLGAKPGPSAISFWRQPKRKPRALNWGYKIPLQSAGDFCGTSENLYFAA